MSDVRVSSDAIEYSVIALDIKCGMLIEQRDHAVFIASMCSGSAPAPIVEYWKAEAEKFERDLQECRRTFLALRSILISLADAKETVVTVFLEETI